MKLYRTITQNEYDWLMQKLEDEGYVWGTTRTKPTEENYWSESREKTVVKVHERFKEISYSDIYFYGETIDDKIIEVSDLMKTTDHDYLMDKLLERNNKPETQEAYTPPNTGDPWIDNLPESYFEMYEVEDAIRPQHYRKGEIDLYESWYRTYPFNEFRAGMQMIAERYMKRDKEDRVQDLDKAMETLKRLKEYEEMEEEE